LEFLSVTNLTIIGKEHETSFYNMETINNGALIKRTGFMQRKEERKCI
jgi:hypothetical protein